MEVHGGGASMITSEIIIHGETSLKSLGKMHLLYNGNSFIDFPVISGGYGKGSLPVGVYEASNLRTFPDTKEYDPYKKEGIPWFITITPKFKTDRTLLGIHPDGNVPGTLGCVGILDHDMLAYYTFKGIFSSYPSIIVSVKNA